MHGELDLLVGSAAFDGCLVGDRFDHADRMDSEMLRIGATISTRCFRPRAMPTLSEEKRWPASEPLCPGTPTATLVFA